MNKLLFLITASFLLTITACSSNDDIIEQKVETNNTIPLDLIGSWKINYAIWVTDPDFVGGNDIGYFIKFNPNNSVEYKDGNKFGGVNVINKSEVKQVSKGNMTDGLTIYINNIPQYIECKKSNKYPGQTEFKIMYPSGSVYYNMILIGTKQ